MKSRYCTAFRFLFIRTRVIIWSYVSPSHTMTDPPSKRSLSTMNTPALRCLRRLCTRVWPSALCKINLDSSVIRTFLSCHMLLERCGPNRLTNQGTPHPPYSVIHVLSPGYNAKPLIDFFSHSIFKEKGCQIVLQSYVCRFKWRDPP